MNVPSFFDGTSIFFIEIPFGSISSAFNNAFGLVEPINKILSPILYSEFVTCALIGPEPVTNPTENFSLL